jgi:hypothetical protein
MVSKYKKPEPPRGRLRLFPFRAMICQVGEVTKLQMVSAIRSAPALPGALRAFRRFLRVDTLR